MKNLDLREIAEMRKLPMEMQRTMEGLREEMQIEREKGGLRFEEESVDKNEESGRLNAPPLYLLASCIRVKKPCCLGANLLLAFSALQLDIDASALWWFTCKPPNCM